MEQQGLLFHNVNENDQSKSTKIDEKAQDYSTSSKFHTKTKIQIHERKEIRIDEKEIIRWFIWWKWNEKTKKKEETGLKLLSVFLKSFKKPRKQ